MHRGVVHIFYEILITRTSPTTSNSAASLRMIFCQRSAFNISQMTEGYYHFVVSIEIFRIKLFVAIHNFATTVISVFFFYFKEFFLNYIAANIFVIENRVIILYLFLQFVKFLMQLVLHQACQLTQTHFYDSSRLDIVKSKTGADAFNCQLGRFSSFDNMNNLINIVARNYQALNYMDALQCFFQEIFCTADNDIMPMLYKIFYTIF